jgi:hypothetical protein
MASNCCCWWSHENFMIGLDFFMVVSWAKFVGYVIGFVFGLSYSCKNKSFIRIQDPLIFKLVDIRWENNIQEKL